MGEYAALRSHQLTSSLAAIAQDLDENKAQIKALEAAIAVLKKDRCHLLTKEGRVKRQLQACNWQGQELVEV